MNSVEILSVIAAVAPFSAKRLYVICQIDSRLVCSLRHAAPRWALFHFYLRNSVSFTVSRQPEKYRFCVCITRNCKPRFEKYYCENCCFSSDDIDIREANKSTLSNNTAIFGSCMISWYAVLITTRFNFDTGGSFKILQYLKTLGSYCNVF